MTSINTVTRYISAGDGQNLKLFTDLLSILRQESVTLSRNLTVVLTCRARYFDIFFNKVLTEVFATDRFWI